LIYVYIYILPAIGLTSSGSSTGHLEAVVVLFDRCTYWCFVGWCPLSGKCATHQSYGHETWDMYILLYSKAPVILSFLSHGSQTPSLYNLNVWGPDYRPNVVPFLDGCKSVWCKPVGTVHWMWPADCHGN